MNETKVYVLSEKALTDVINQIKDDQWYMKLPEWFQLGGNQNRNELTLKDIINYHAFDTAWVPDTLAGKTAEDVGKKYDGDLLGDDPKASYNKFAELAVKAAENAHEPGKMVHLSYGDWPTKEYFKHITSFRGFRAYDLAKLIGADTKLPDDLVKGMWDEIAPDAEEWRKMGVFGPAIIPPEDADLQSKLLNLAGRPL